MKYITPEEYEIAASNGINKRVLDRRLYGLRMDRVEAITRPLGHTCNTRYLITAERNGISRQTFKNRVYKEKWSKERACTEPVHKTGRWREKGEVS